MRWTSTWVPSPTVSQQTTSWEQEDEDWSEFRHRSCPNLSFVISLCAAVLIGPCCWRSLIHIWFCFALRCVMVGIIPACRLYMRSWIFSHVQVFRRTKRGGVLMKSSTDDSIKELAKKQITEASEEKSGKQLIPSITDKSPATGCLSGIKQLILMQSRLCRVPFWSGAAAG